MNDKTDTGQDRRFNVILDDEGAASDARATGRFLSLMLLGPTILAAIALIAWIAAPNRYVATIEAAIALVLLPCFLLAALLAHRNRNSAAAWVLVVATALSTLVTQLAAVLGMNPIYQASDASVLTYLVIPVFISAAVLSRRQTIAVTCVLVVTMLAIPQLIPEIIYAELIPGPILLVSILTLLLVIFSSHNERLQQQRLDALNEEITMRRAAETELARHRDELESLVSARTRDLEETMVQLRDANQAKSRFLANMSHELRTPLNSIIGFTGMVHDGLAGDIPDEARRQLEMANRSGKQLLGIVNDLLNLSKIETGATHIELRRIRVSAVLSSVCDMVRPLAIEKGLRLSYIPGEDIEIECDIVKLQQIMLNLTANAVKFTEDGEITVSHDVDGDTILMRVIDTGPGIPAEQHDAVFEAFHQLEPRKVAKSPGAGLGLAISRELAHLLGGGLTLKSPDGQGSEFVLTLPIRHTDPV